MPRGRTATILFTDLVGSTELLGRLGEGGFDDLRRDHFAALGGAVERAAGEQVKTLGDGILAVFPSAADAVACAVAIQQGADRQARTGPAPIAVRVGLALGDVSVEDGDVFGTPVVEAARLVAAARPGQILCSDLVRAVAGGRSGAAFTDAGLLALKGLPDPVAVCEIGWEPAVAAAARAVPLPVLLTGTSRIFVGREEELDRLGQLWKEASAGERRMALLGGEPGIGKTRLAAEHAARVHAEGATVLAGRCDEDLGVPFQPFVEALRHYVLHAGEPRLGRHPGELTRLVPELARVVPGLPEPLRSDPDTERYRLFEAVASWLADVSTETPVLLVLDDLQWAAKPTLLLLRHILRFPEAKALLAVATYRDTDLGRGHPLTELLADLRRVGGMERMVLGGLDCEAVGAYIEAAAGHALPDDDDGFTRVVFEETEGNPFFVAEVLRHLSESGAIEQRDGRWVTTAPADELGIPEGVRDVIGRRLSRLSDTANRILAVASVVGLQFEADIVRVGGAVEEDDLFSALEEATTARLVSEVAGTQFRFAHALVRATLYDELSGPRRAALHRRVPEGIETVHRNRLEDHLPALAHHWSRAAAPAAETGKAVEYATRAGDRALAQLAHDEAITYYRQALEFLDAAGGGDDAHRRVHLLLSLGEAQRRSGERAFRDTLAAAAALALQEGDATALARIALAGSRGVLSSVITSVDHDRVSVLRAAVDGLGPADSPIRARLLAQLSLELTYAVPLESRLQLADEALAVARRVGDPSTMAEVLAARVMSTGSPDSLAERQASIRELIAAADAVGDPMLVAWSRFLHYRTSVEAADTAGAQPALEAVQRIADELRQPTLRWLATWSRAAYDLFAGRIEESERLVHAAADLADATGQPDAQLFRLGQLFAVRFEQGRLDEMRGSWIHLAAGTAHPVVHAMLALLHSELDERDDAERVFGACAASEFSGHPVDSFWTFTMPQLAVVASYLGDRRRAEALHGLLAPYRERIAGVASIWAGSVSHYLGLLDSARGRYDDADSHFAYAAALHERIGAPTWLARTRLESARMLLRRQVAGDAERAGNLLDQVVVTAADLGLANVGRRAGMLAEAVPSTG